MALQSTGNLQSPEDILRIFKASAPPSDKNLLNPRNALCFWDGEWIVLSGGKVIRACDVASEGNASTNLNPKPLFSEKGNGYSQAHPAGIMDYIVGPRGIRLFTRVYKKTLVVGSGGAITGAYGQGLKVASISVTTPDGTRIVSGLVGHGGSGDSHPVVGYVIEENNGVLEFEHR